MGAAFVYILNAAPGRIGGTYIFSIGWLKEIFDRK